MGLLLAIAVAIYAFKVFCDLGASWLISIPLCLAIVGLWFLPGINGLLGIVLFCGAALMLGMIQKSVS